MRFCSYRRKRKYSAAGMANVPRAVAKTEVRKNQYDLAVFDMGAEQPTRRAQSV